MTFAFTDTVQIEEAYGFWTDEAADQYLSECEPCEDDCEPFYHDCDDSDDGWALASAGWGTDEDYGYACDF